MFNALRTDRTPASFVMLIRRLAYYGRSVFTLLFGIINWPTIVAAFVGVPFKHPFTIVLRRTGLRFKVRTPMDVWVVKETCIDREYDRVGMAVQAGWHVIDIGAALGDFSIDAAARHQHCVIHAYEPFPTSFVLLRQNLQLNNIHNVVAYQEAVAGQAGEVTLDVSTAVAVRHSTVTPTNAGISVPAITLATAVGRLPDGTCDLLKLDCEGAEYAILFNTDAQILGRIRRIVMEYHNNVVEFSHHDLARFLTANGFVVSCYPSKVQPYIGLLYATKQI